MMHVMQNCVAEWSCLSGRHYTNPFTDVLLRAVVVDPEGHESDLPAFWSGGHEWRFRYSSPLAGIHRFRTICSDMTNGSLHDIEGEIQVSEYTGDNPLYGKGPLRKSLSGTHLEHQDGTPFYWLGDTWWMGLTKRLHWPDGFQTLVRDRVRKGFNVVQIVAGLYPDMDPFDERGANEAGFPWDREYTSINPEYFDTADLKIFSLVNAGIVPCIVGCWGFFIDFAGKDVLTRHWDYLVARYGAYPVVWCMAGEALAPFYLHTEWRDPEKRPEHEADMRRGWTEITKHVKQLDPFHRPITIHPTRYGHEMVDDPSLLDLDMLQTGHGGYSVLASTVEMIESSVAREPRLPVIDSEGCYEGICGSSYEDIQRFLFWSCALSGTCGHTYGANGIWQVNSREQPYGPSPHGAAWGNTPWEEACQLAGSKQVGLGKKLLEKYEWWNFRQHPEWVEAPASKDNGYMGAFAAGIPGSVRVFFLPGFVQKDWGKTLIKKIENDARYRAYFYDPITGKEYDQGLVEADGDGNWISGKISIFQDWVLVLKKEV